LGKNKSAKEISKLISNLMQMYKLTRSDLGRGLVVLDNLSQEFTWKNGLFNKIDKPEKVVKLKEKKPAVLEECVS
jgi:hypothetical protein